jgi:type VI secretion system secreted protein Hcp
MAQADFFLKLDSVPGESTDDKHKGEIEIDSFSWGEVNSGSAGHGGGGGSGKVVAQDMSFTKRIDKASAVLMIACATGQHFKDAVLTARKAGGGQQEYLKIKIEEVFVSSYQTSGAGSAMVQESFSVNFSKLEMSYKEQKPDGSLGGETKQKYDFSANKKL